MNEDQFRLLLGILLIRKHKQCRNAYGLTKTLSMFFGIIDSPSFIKSLVDAGVVAVKKVKTLNHFTLTDRGLDEYIKNASTNDFHMKLLKTYPDKKMYIDLLYLQ